MHAGDNRALAWATLASLALHVVLVLGWPRMQERLRPAPAPPIVSRLVEPPAPPPAPAPPPTAEPQPVPKPPAERKPRAEKPAAKSVAKPMERASEPLPPPAAKEEVVESRPPIESPAVSVAPAPSSAPAPAPPAKPAVDVATTIAQYRMQVLSAARRLKSRYPDLARENNWTGSVVVALAVGADGAPEVKVRSGTGHAPLDEQASEMFRQAARAVPVPPALQGRAFSVELKAVYGLVD